MPHVGVTELLIVLFLVLFIFGAGKLPDISRGIAKSVREFRAGVADDPRRETAARQSGEAEKT